MTLCANHATFRAKMNLCNRIILLFVWLILDAKIEAYKSGCSGGYCFVISDHTNGDEFLDQSHAQQWCLSNGTKLVEITGEDIQNFLVNSIRSIYSQGLNGWSVFTNGKRSSDYWIRLTGNNISDLRVKEQYELSFAYGYLKSTTFGFDLFASKPTNNKGGFICTGVSNCSAGVTLNGQCYKSYTETLSWYDARNRCLDGGGDLASFDYITTNARFNALNGSWINPSYSYWIGIRRESWTWQESNSDVKHSDWMNGHPLNEVGRINSDCLCLSTEELKWIECGCNQQLPFVCISDNKVSSTASTTTPTTHTITTTPSTTKTTQSTTSTDRSTASAESNGLPTPTIPAPNSIPAKNASGDMEQTRRLTDVGVAVGLGVGIPLIIVIAVLAVIVARWKKKYRQAMVLLDTNQKTSSKNEIQQSATGGVMHELNDVVVDPYESLKPRLERTSVDGLYQTLDHSTKTDI